MIGIPDPRLHDSMSLFLQWAGEKSLISKEFQLQSTSHQLACKKGQRWYPGTTINLVYRHFPILPSTWTRFDDHHPLPWAAVLPSRLFRRKSLFRIEWRRLGCVGNRRMSRNIRNGRISCTHPCEARSADFVREIDKMLNVLLQHPSR